MYEVIWFFNQIMIYISKVMNINLLYISLLLFSN